MTFTAIRPEVGLSKGPGGVATEGFPGFAVDFGFEGCLKCLVGVSGAEEVGVADRRNSLRCSQCL